MERCIGGILSGILEITDIASKLWRLHTNSRGK